MADVCITEFTGPGCPWVFSAEPFRARLTWLYGDDLEWKVRLVGLAATPEDNEKKGLTAKQAKGLAKIAREHGHGSNSCASQAGAPLPTNRPPATQQHPFIDFRNAPMPALRRAESGSGTFLPRVCDAALRRGE